MCEVGVPRLREQMSKSSQSSALAEEMRLNGNEGSGLGLVRAESWAQAEPSTTPAGHYPRIFPVRGPHRISPQGSG